MRKFIYSALIAAGLTAAGSVLAQGSGLDSQPGGNAGPTFGPPVGTPEYYGNSGYVPPPTPRYYIDRGPAYPYIVPDRRDRDRDRDRVDNRRDRDRDRIDNRRDRDRRDRDGDGVANRRDRQPDDPNRY